MRKSLIAGGRVFTGDPRRPWAEAIAVRGTDVVAVGSLREAREHVGPDASLIEVDGGLVLPGFVDGHVHIAAMGAVLEKAHLRSARDLGEIIQRLREWAESHPDSPRVLGTNWQYTSVPEGRPHRKQLDAAFPDRPVYLEAYDFHSSWVNTVALREMGIGDDTPDPIGGRIVRDNDGSASGHLLETANSMFVARALGGSSLRVLQRRIEAAMQVFSSAGITSVTEMALKEDDLLALVAAREAGTLTTRVAAHYYVPRSGDPTEEMAHVHRAAELANQFSGDRLRVNGVKFVADGTIDGCTAAMSAPYTNGVSTEPIWDAGSLKRVVAAADGLGLQIAIHAIGDRAIDNAIDALAHATSVNGAAVRHHRLEHLEVATESQIERIADAGIVASMQPVHSDPEICHNWAANLGPERAARGWNWPAYLSSGATLAFGTDAPTAPHPPLENMYVAATRRSVADRSLDPIRPEWALTMEEAIFHGTRDSAAAALLDRRIGSLTPGRAADLVILDRDPLAAGPETLLDAAVRLTMVDGVIVHPR